MAPEDRTMPMSGSKKKVELNYPRIELVAFLSLGEDIQVVAG